MPVDLSSASTTQWQFDLSHLENTPSSSEGIPFESEYASRRSAINKMMEICSNLHLEDYTKHPTFRERTGKQGGYASNGDMLLGRTETEHEQYLAVGKEFQNMPRSKDVLWTAATFLHRFYMRYSLSAYSHREIAATCVYIALKVEDRLSIKAQHVGRVSKRAYGDSAVNATAKWENFIITHEETVLEALCYDLTLEQPLGALLRGFEKMRSWIRKLKAELAEGNSQVKGEGSGSGVGTSVALQEKGNGVKIEEGDVKPPVAANARLSSRLEKGKGKEATSHSNGLMESVVLELAYVICHETITTPLCLVALPNHIAATSLFLALSMITRLPLGRLLEKVDEIWVKAFCEGYFRPEMVGDAEDLRKKIRETSTASLQFRDKKLMADVLDPEWKVEDLAEPVDPALSDSELKGASGSTKIMANPALSEAKEAVSVKTETDAAEGEKAESVTKLEGQPSAEEMDVDLPSSTQESTGPNQIASAQPIEAGDLVPSSETRADLELRGGPKAATNSPAEEGELPEEDDDARQQAPKDAFPDQDEPML